MAFISGPARADMSECANQAPYGTEVPELVQLLTNILDTARRLPQGPERIAAFKEISDFQSRLGAILRRRPRGRIGL
jgi:hypothetical protein